MVIIILGVMTMENQVNGLPEEETPHCLPSFCFDSHLIKTKNKTKANNKTIPPKQQQQQQTNKNKPRKQQQPKTPTPPTTKRHTNPSQKRAYTHEN